MMIEPRQYTEICSSVRRETRASLVILVIVDGSQGTGFDIVGTEPTAGEWRGGFIPQLLRNMADSIEVVERERQ
jgi:hypothetical protein